MLVNIWAFITRYWYGIALLVLTGIYLYLSYVDRSKIKELWQDAEKGARLIEKSAIEIRDAIIADAHKQAEQIIVETQEKERARISENIILSEENERMKLDRVLESYAAQTIEQIELMQEQENTAAEEVALLRQEYENTLSAYIEKILALRETYRIAELSAMERSRYQLQLSHKDNADVSFLLGEVVPKLASPIIIRKLIWTEYIRDKAAELAARVLPNGVDCSGIYKITNLLNQKVYIGRAVSVRGRILDHIKNAIVAEGSLTDQYIHATMREVGLDNFTFELLEECDRANLAEREKFYIAAHNSNVDGYNRTIGG